MNRETRKLITVFRDFHFLMAVNCALDPPLRPLSKDISIKELPLLKCEKTVLDGRDCSYREVISPYFRLPLAFYRVVIENGGR